jgi:hypothetical protein
VPMQMSADLLVPSLVHDEQYHADIDRSHSDRVDPENGRARLRRVIP